MLLRSFLICLLAIGSWSCRQTQHVWQHYSMYEVNGADVIEEDVALRTFGFASIDATVNQISHYVIPVEKTTGAGAVSPIKDIDLRFNAWKIDQDTEERSWNMTMVNQFGEQFLTAGQPKELLVPANQIEPEPRITTKLQDHYKCYELLDDAPTSTTVTLSDELGAESVTVVRAVRLCVPVEKSGVSHFSRINFENNYLVIYEVEPKTAHSQKLLSKDQFGNHRLTTTRRTWLCVPSLRLR